MMMQFALRLDAMNGKLDKLLGDQRQQFDFEEIKKSLDTDQRTAYVDLAGLGGMYLISLWYLFGAIL